MRDTRACDLYVGAGFIAGAAYVLHLSGQLQKMPRGIGPAGYPAVIAVLMIILGAAQIARVLRGGMPSLSFSIDRSAAGKAALVVAASFIYVGLIRYFGFLILTPALLFFLMLLFNYRKYAKAAMASLGVSVCTWFVFAKIFQIFLPSCAWL